jgi:hypothetical protein
MHSAICNKNVKKLYSILHIVNCKTELYKLFLLKVLLVIWIGLSIVGSIHASEPHMEIVRRLAGFGPREYGTEAARKAAEYIQAEFRSFGIRQVTIQRFTQPRNGYNVIAVIPGHDTSRQIVLSAHHDSAPGAPGAYDDAAGVAVLLNLAAYFSTEKPPYTLIFCSFDAEEAGLIGSITYARSLRDQERNRILFMLCLEMMGWEKGYPVIQTLKYEVRRRNRLPNLSTKVRGLLTSYSLASLVMKSADRTNAGLHIGDPFLSPLYQAAIRLLKVRFYGDDFSFILSGIPAVLFTDSSFSAFYPDYHGAGDVPDRVSEHRLQVMSRLIKAIIENASWPSNPHPYTARQEQEYWFAGPLHFNYFLLLFLFVLSQVLLIWWSFYQNHLNFSNGSLLILESVLSAVLFYRFPTSIFVILGLSTFLFLTTELLRLRNWARLIFVHMPQLLLIIFVGMAISEQYLYGTYLSPAETFILVGIFVFSVRRVFLIRSNPAH